MDLISDFIRRRENRCEEWLVIDDRLEKTALTLARAILECSVACAQRVEEAFQARATEPGKFKDQDFQDIATEFAHLLIHLCDREAFENIPNPKERGTFLNSVSNYLLQFGTTQPMTDEHPSPTFTRQIEPRILVEGFGMDRLNDRQAQYSRLKLFPAQGKSLLAGTLFGEFGDYVVKVCDRYNHDPFIQMEAQILATEAYKALIPLMSFRYPADSLEQARRRDETRF